MPTYTFRARPVPVPVPVDTAGSLVLAAHLLNPSSDISDLMGLSGVAFATYAFTPADNYHYDVVHPGVTTHDAVFELEHFGIVESLSVHLATELRPYTLRRPLDLAALVKAEHSMGRAVALRSLALDSAPTWWLTLPPGTDDADAREIALELDARQQGQPPELAYALVSRPRSGDPAVSNMAHVLMRELWDYLFRHAESGKELAQDHDVFLASGRRALQVIVSRLERGASLETSEVSWLWRWLGVAAQRRTHGGRFLKRWAAGIRAADPRWYAVGPDAESLDQLGDALLVTSVHLEQAQLQLESGNPLAAAAQVAAAHRDEGLALVG